MSIQQSISGTSTGVTVMSKIQNPPATQTSRTPMPATEPTIARPTGRSGSKSRRRLRNLLGGLITATTMLSGTGSTASAQNMSAPMHDERDDSFKMETRNEDLRWFEPLYGADIADMKPMQRANSGFFATYDKLKLYGSRPDLDISGDPFSPVPQRSFNRLDDGNGNRYEFGYMDRHADNGFVFTYSEYDVGAGNTVRRERLNRQNPDVAFGLVDGIVAPPRQLAPGRTFTPILSDANVFGFDFRFVDVGNSLNNISVDSFELMKSWRMEPYHYGGILEPMAGFRYSRLKDRNFDRQYDASVIDTITATSFISTNVFGDFTSATITELGAEAVEEVVERFANTENDVITAQAGFRYFKYFDRVRFSTDFRVFTGINLQQSTTGTNVQVTFYDGIDAGADIVRTLEFKDDRIEIDDDAFVVGFDVRSELSYQLSKMISVRGGFQLVDYATGIWRGGPGGTFSALDGGSRDQNFLAVGGTFGVEINR